MRFVSLWLSLLLVLCACGEPDSSSGSTEPSSGDEVVGEVSPADSEAEPGPPFGLMNGANPADELYTAGQPSGASLEAAYAGGVRTVISLRAEDEPGQEEEAEAVERLGMRFERLVVRGPADVTAENARLLEELFVEASNHGETLLHCGSSNRVGALMALRAFFVFDSTLTHAIEQGRAAGLASLEGRVRVVLEQTCADAPDDARCLGESTP